MTFWDSSALLSLLAGQSTGMELRALAEQDPALVLWWGTPVELVSGICRLHKQALIDDERLTDLISTIERIASEADEVEPSERVRAAAIRMLRVHSLRAADALQLAAALVRTEHNPSSVRFVCLDRRLCAAAAREGFTVLPK